MRVCVWVCHNRGDIFIGVTHRDPSVLQVDAVSVDAGERNSIRVGDLVGGEWGVGARDGVRDRQWEGGVERPVDGDGACEGGVDISMSNRPPCGPWICGVTYSLEWQLCLGCGVVTGSRGGALSGGCPVPPPFPRCSPPAMR